ncbi:peptidoglycan-binding protein [Coralloluteibacterium stylophorae]|uniref:Peptidoglycan-binding protein n=1 Tax=Coralloluteibacterium stylophorae TaxID=1776034 RepID=A0A8J7VQ83_9GAMM|nr:peptidoglycan-binding protein [Coralloluteibacterium stylophorae]MBS7456846.1 peptidoglycan-binding protein [Coralloluteibacterium stylophorae]
MNNPIYDLMYRGESGAAGYNAFNRGTFTDGNGRERIRSGEPPMDFSRLTLGQVQDLQHLPREDPERVFAVGKYQIIPSTMDVAVARLGLDRSEPFTPELQDRIFTDYLLREKQHAVRDYIMGVPGVNLEEAQNGLAREWASFGDPYKDGRSYYGGANRAHISLAESAAALMTMRAAYADATARGASSDDAWHAAAAVDAQPIKQAWHEKGHAPPEGSLRRDDRGDAVRTLQEQLDQLGYTDAAGRALTADGVFGARTEQAVRAYQRDNGLTVDGIVGPETRAAVREQIPSRGAETLRAGATGLLDAAERGEDAVREAMERLARSSLGERWRQQLDEAHLRTDVPVQCDAPQTQDLARGER